ncbi:cupin domain-containing protein [Roseisolibacter sp. H3M3-2]|uniref:cupin domain-containing protein n=1 Tax=Roseisolibacter sp. H3M3-2 TaxID=3031323 RepID=UPI0023DBA18D|nr:cupin domain-containing protein [Roseisolibacter sp. H3M3-2]MDF1505920.1 cupin domain-containing protein [Roseisolibacter sp. H3M3-2]
MPDVPSPEAYAAEPVAFPPLTVVDLAATAASWAVPYRNAVVGRVNDGCLRLAAFEGEYPWHRHPHSDELFLVVEGTLAIDLADGTTVTLTPWRAATVPAGVVHRTRALGRVVNACVERLAAATEFVDPPAGSPAVRDVPS